MQKCFWRLAVGLVAIILATTSQAYATSITFYLDQNGTGSVPSAGTIALNDGLTGEGPDTIDVLVTLNPGFEFAKTGSGDALAFNLAGDPAVSIVDITDGIAIGPTNANEPPFGSFNYAVSCTSGCGNGGSNPTPGPLTFDVVLSGITLDMFVGNSQGYYFTADLTGRNLAALGQANISEGGLAAIPEPMSLSLVGAGLIGTVLRQRRRRS